MLVVAISLLVEGVVKSIAPQNQLAFDAGTGANIPNTIVGAGDSDKGAGPKAKSGFFTLNRNSNNGNTTGSFWRGNKLTAVEGEDNQPEEEEVVDENSEAENNV